MEPFLASLSPWLESKYFGNSVQDYLVALAILLGFWIFFRFIKKRLFSFLALLGRTTPSDIDDQLVNFGGNIPGPLYFFAALYCALMTLNVSELLMKIVYIGLVFFLIFWLVRVITQLIEFALAQLAKKRGIESLEKTNAYFILSLISKVVLWSIGLLVILSNLGIDVTALTTSLGIGGIAVALAVQRTLGDILSSFSIYLDKPFEVGDFIVVGTHMGTVKKIGLKSTRIQALQGEEIIISNNELTTTRVQNFKRLEKRRVAFEITIKSETSPETLAQIPGLLETVIKSHPLVEFDRVHFIRFGSGGFIFEIVYNINSSDYRVYMDLQQAINLDLLKTLQAKQIQMAI